MYTCYMYVVQDAKMYDVDDLTRYGTTVTGYHIMDTTRIEVKEFYMKWSKLNPLRWPGAGQAAIRVSKSID